MAVPVDLAGALALLTKASGDPITALDLREVITWVDNNLGGGGSPEDVTATPGTLALRNGTGGIAATSVESAADLALVASTCTTDYNALICDVDTTITLRDGGTDRAVITTAAAFTTVLNAGLTSFDLSWAQDASAAGGALGIAGQRGFGGFIGGNVKIASGKGGTLGTNLGGGITFELGQQVSGFTDRISFREDATEFLFVRRASSTARIESAGSIYLDASSTLTIGAACATMDLGSTGASVTTLNGSSVTVASAGNIVLSSVSRYCSQDEIRYRTAANATKLTETVANAYVRLYDAAVTGISENWTAASAGAGGSRTISAQKGAGGSDGGDLVCNVGDGGTAGTNAPGDFSIDLGTRVTSGTTGKFRLTRTAGATALASFYNQELANYNIFNMEGNNLQILMPSNVWEASCLYLSFQVSGGALDVSSATTVTGNHLECTGQFSSDTNDVAFSATPTLNNNLSNHHRIGALTANITTLDMSNLRDGAIYTVMVTQDGTGGWTIGWAAKFRFGTTYTNVPDATASSVTIWTFLSDGTNLRCIGKEVGLT